MLKKVFALLGVFAFTLFLVRPFSVQASEFVIPWESAIPDLGLAYGIYGLLGAGAEIDLSSFDTYEDARDYLANHTKASEFTSKSFSSYQAIKSQVTSEIVQGTEYLLPDSVSVKIPFNAQDLYGNLLAYNTQNLLSLSTFVEPSDYIPVDETLQPLLSKIASNSVGVYNSNTLGPCYWISGPSKGDFSLSNNASVISVNSNFNTGAQNNLFWYDVYYVSSGAIYLRVRGDGTCYIEQTIGFSPTFNGLSNSNGSFNYVYQLGYKARYGTGYYSQPQHVNSIPNFQSEFAGISTALNYISQHFRLTSIYVNGFLWNAALGNPGGSALTDDPVSFPSAVDVNGDLLYTVAVPGNPSDNLAIDLTAILSLINSIVNDSSADKTLTLDDVMDVVTDVDTDTVVTPVPLPIDTVIGTIKEIDDTGGIPIIPPVPTFYQEASLAGTTVLSELIDGTMHVIPLELSVALWGLFGILVILGLLHIFHK